jgi:hypothetical protein
MQSRNLLLAAAILAATSPSLVYASAQKSGLNACAHAFAASMAAPGTAAPTFKLNYNGTEQAGPLASYYDREYTFYLQAKNPKTGLALATATCSVDTKGIIVALKTLPADSAGATLAARF